MMDYMSKAYKLFFSIMIIAIAILMGVGFHNHELEAQSGAVPRNHPEIRRLEFPQDGVVCYKINHAAIDAALSCVKVR